MDRGLVLIPVGTPEENARALHEEVTALAAAAERVRMLSRMGGLEALDEDLLGQVADELAAVSASTEAVCTATLGRADAVGVPAREGFKSAGSWWRARRGMSLDRARAQCRLARRLRRHYTETATAWGLGNITVEHARVLVSGLDGLLRRHEEYARRRARELDCTLQVDQLREELAENRALMEETLLRSAIVDGLTPEQLRLAVDVLRDAADPDGGSESEIHAGEKGELRLREVGERCRLSGELSREQGALMRTLLDHFRAGRYARGGTDNPVDGDPEIDLVTEDPVVVPNKRKDYEAFVDLLDHVAGQGLGSGTVGERPHLDVTVTLAELAAGTGHAVLERTGSPVPVRTAGRRISCDCDVTVVLVDGVYRNPQTGEELDPVTAGILIAGTGVVDYGRRHRIVPTRLRRALRIRDRGCAFPGCHRPAHLTQAHHVIHWCDHGKTSLDKTVLLCSEHHHAVHEGGWQIRPREGLRPHQPGYWSFHPPDFAMTRGRVRGPHRAHADASSAP